ncbi:hypothetical protein OPQ81_003646 [Rhizoctonia solani]|nr:hypothetical protein OPQ81_003646 [Rhizoctonia solani]
MAIEACHLISPQQFQETAAELAQDFARLSDALTKMGLHEKAFDASQEAAKLYQTILGIPALSEGFNFVGQSRCSCTNKGYEQEHESVFKSGKRVRSPKSTTALFLGLFPKLMLRSASLLAGLKTGRAIDYEHLNKMLF